MKRTTSDPSGTETFSSTINVDEARLYKLIQIAVVTLSSTNIIAKVYCRASVITSWYTAATKTITAAGDEIVNLVEPCFEIRVGLQSTGDIATADSVNVRADYR